MFKYKSSGCNKPAQSKLEIITLYVSYSKNYEIIFVALYSAPISRYNVVFDISDYHSLHAKTYNIISCNPEILDNSNLYHDLHPIYFRLN